MLKKRFKRLIPDRKQLAEYKSLKIFGNLIHNPNLWHLNRYSVSRAFSVGLFCAWIPLPFQMAFSAAGALLFHANIPISIALVWLTNPLTMPFLFFLSYKLGAVILNVPVHDFEFEPSVDWLLSVLSDKWQPFLLGSLICAIACSVLGNLMIRGLWRYATIRSWRARKHRFHPGRFIPERFKKKNKL